MNNQPLQIPLADILVVDDHPDNLRVLSSILNKQGYETRGVISGKMALRSAQAMPPDLILLDIMMPEMDGYEVCQQLKTDKRTYEIPIIFISAKDEALDKVKAFGMGGVDYITKPFNFEEVLARIQNHVNLNKLQKQLQEQNMLLQQEICSRQEAEKALQKQNVLLQQEIGERQRAEAALKKSNQELARSNAELEQFASIVSHDLRAPLTTITSYANLLEQCYQKSLDAKANGYIARLIEGCDRMQILIDDLLEYSQVSKNKQPFEAVDCNKVLKEACANLQLEISKHQAVVIYDNLPVVMANSSQLVQLFQNLIGNAIKYHSDRPPEIHIKASLETNNYLFSVQDNGIGIQPQNFERIFQIFQRLHTRKEYPGTGIGLAICQKIVERHSGRIWVESEPGIGSTFYFTLPYKNDGKI